VSGFGDREDERPVFEVQAANRRQATTAAVLGFPRPGIFHDLELILSLYSLLEIIRPEAWNPSTDDEPAGNSRKTNRREDMQRIFNAREIFDIAIGIERRGRKFYSQAADAFDDPGIKTLLKDLSEMEKEHEEVFVSLKKGIPDKGYAHGYDPDEVAAAYLRSLTSGEVFRGDLFFAGSESAEEILKKGIEAEKNSIMFYTGLREIVPRDLGRERVDRIIREEMSHIILLTERLASLE